MNKDEMKKLHAAEEADYSFHQKDPDAKPTTPEFDSPEGRADENDGPGVYREGHPEQENDPTGKEDTENGPGVGYDAPKGNIHSGYKFKRS